MDSWLKETMERLGSDAQLSDADAELLLEAAKIAAHTSGARSNAPLLCYLIGRVQGDRNLDGILEQVRRSSS